MNETLPFFVYGSLIPGQDNDHYWQDQIVRTTSAEFRGGDLYDLGHYPMMIRSMSGDDVVKGALVEVPQDKYAQIMAGLDELEAYFPSAPELSMYIRVAETVFVDGETPIQAWVYLGRFEFAFDHPIVRHGDWVRYLCERSGAPAPISATISDLS